MRRYIPQGSILESAECGPRDFNGLSRAGGGFGRLHAETVEALWVYGSRLLRANAPPAGMKRDLAFVPLSYLPTTREPDTGPTPAVSVPRWASQDRATVPAALSVARARA